VRNKKTTNETVASNETRKTALKNCLICLIPPFKSLTQLRSGASRKRRGNPCETAILSVPDRAREPEKLRRIGLGFESRPRSQIIARFACPPLEEETHLRPEILDSGAAGPFPSQKPHSRLVIKQEHSFRRVFFIPSTAQTLPPDQPPAISFSPEPGYDGMVSLTFLAFPGGESLFRDYLRCLPLPRHGLKLKISMIHPERE